MTDTGKGISESNQAAIFRRFYREEEVHDQQGVGIGLYLAREIVTKMCIRDSDGVSRQYRGLWTAEKSQT